MRKGCNPNETFGVAFAVILLILLMMEMVMLMMLVIVRKNMIITYDKNTDNDGNNINYNLDSKNYKPI